MITHLASIRSRRGVTQKQCASRIEVHQTTWSRWERNRQRGKIITLTMRRAIDDAAKTIFGGIQIDIEDMSA